MDIAKITYCGFLKILQRRRSGTGLFLDSMYSLQGRRLQIFIRIH